VESKKNETQHKVQIKDEANIAAVELSELLYYQSFSSDKSRI
jgi:hypothetical protein